MKVLSLTQPWASLVACGAKKIETRSWSTIYRGPLAIHAAKGFPKEARRFASQPVCYNAMHVHGHILEDEEPAYPLGVVLATCRLTACLPVIDVRNLSDQEKAFGNYTPGRWAWFLTQMEPMVRPIPAKGKLGLWEFELGF